MFLKYIKYFFICKPFFLYFLLSILKFLIASYLYLLCPCFSSIFYHYTFPILDIRQLHRYNFTLYFYIVPTYYIFILYFHSILLYTLKNRGK